MADAMARNDEHRRKGNMRLALILASVALVFFLGFIARMVLLGN
jgi:hypothetical protein